MISKKIHQIWVGDRPAPYKIMESWQRYCDKFGWEYCLWDESSIERLNLVNKNIYNFYKYESKIQDTSRYQGMSDIARLEIVNQFGGYYFDCDFYSWGNDIEKIVNLDHNMGVFSTENLYPSDCTHDKTKSWWVKFDGNFDSAHFICNGTFYANPNNNILTDTINGLDEVFYKNKLVQWDNHGITLENANWLTCGCWQLTNFSKKYPFILLSPKFVFSSIEYAIENKEKFIPQIISSYLDNHDENRLNILNE